VKCEEWHVSTTNVKSDSPQWLHSTSYVNRDSSPLEMWRVTPLTFDVKRDSSPHQMWNVISP
jgi:hypothetical protein